MHHLCQECGLIYQAPGHCPADGAPLVPWGEDPLLGTTVGNYRIVKLLGKGGMGSVYRAVQPSIGGRVAIKVLSQDCSQNRELIERFFAEARAVNLIRHEHIVNVTDLAFLPDGRPYIVMEHLDGAPLSGVIAQRGALPLGGFAAVMGEALDAIGAAHAKGIVHRDLKPDNIFVTPAGHAKVLDFGIAKLAPELDGRSAATRAGSIMGTPHYMSPEQARGETVDARTDIYAMGVILYEGTTGMQPFSAASLYDIMRQHIEVPPVPPRNLRADIPPALEAVIQCALEKDRERRFPTAGHLAHALSQATQELPQDQWANISIAGGAAAGPGTARSVRSRVSQAQLVAPAGTVVGGKSGLGWKLGLGALLAAAAVTIIVLATRSKGDAKGAPTGGGVVVGNGGGRPDTRGGGVVDTGGGGQSNPNSRILGGMPGGTDERVDVKHLDVDQFLVRSTELARGLKPDAELVFLYMENVYPSGFADLTLSDKTNFMLRYRSPKESDSGGKPKGVRLECQVNVMVRPIGVNVFPFSTDQCNEVMAPNLKCKPRDVWARALAKGADKDSVGAIQMYTVSGKPQWAITVGPQYFGPYDDDCK